MSIRVSLFSDCLGRVVCVYLFLCFRRSDKRYECRESNSKNRPRINSYHSEHQRRPFLSCEDGQDAVEAQEHPPVEATDGSSQSIKPLLRDDEHSFSAVSGSGGGINEKCAVDPNSPKAFYLPKQTTPKLGTVSISAERLWSRHHNGKTEVREGIESFGSSLLASSDSVGETTVAKSSKESLLVSRNYSILKSLFSGGPDAGAGFSGDQDNAGFSYEFVLWKTAKRESATATATREEKNSALPPPPLQEFPKNGAVTNSLKAVELSEGRDVDTGGDCDVLTRSSLEMTSMTPLQSKVILSGSRSSPPQSRASAFLSTFAKLVMGQQPQGGKYGRYFVTGMGEVESMAAGAHTTRLFPVPAQPDESRNYDGGVGKSSDKTTHSLLPQRASPIQSRNSPPLPSPRLSPRAARVSTCPCTIKLISVDSGPHTLGPGRLLALKASPPPGGSRVSLFKPVSGTDMRTEGRIGEGGSDAECKTDSPSSRGSVKSGDRRWSYDAILPHGYTQMTAPENYPPPLVLDKFFDDNHG